MFVNAREVPSLVNCRIAAWGHTDVRDDSRFQVRDQVEYIHQILSAPVRAELLAGGVSAEEVVETWRARTGIGERVFFDGPIEDMAAIAAKKCLVKADIPPGQVDVIIGGTNTGPGYPSLADHIKLRLGDEASQAMAFDMTEACSVGASSIMIGWNLIHSGFARRILIVCAERATTLTSPDNWKEANLFGDAAFAVCLTASEEESFLFFDADSMPFGGNVKRIYRSSDTGFYQDGPRVHKFVGSVVAKRLVAGVAEAGINPKDIAHWVPHQPSAKTLDLLFNKVTGQTIAEFLENPDAPWYNFRGVYHRNVETTGNTSGASTGSIISKAGEDGIIKPGETVVVAAFGAGLSVANYGFISA